MHPSVKYELQEIEKIFADREEGSDMPPIASLRSRVRNEVERIKQTLVYEVFHFEDERHRERYIQYHQQALIRLMDRSGRLRDGDNEDEFDQIFYNALDELLSFIERHFTKYFDQDAKAPNVYLSQARKDAAMNIVRLEKALTARDTERALIELVLRTIKKVSDSSPEKGTTYRKVMYAKEVVKELTRIIENPNTDVNEELRQLFYYLNYNSIKVVTYHAHYFNKAIDTIETRSEKIEQLSLFLKTVSQAQVKPGIGYNMQGPSLKSQLGEYLSIEIEYHERLQHLTGRSSGPPSDDLLSGFKLKFDASVSQLAYILRVLIDTKIILNNNLTHVINFLVKFATTKRVENVSHGSLRSKFYNTESGTKESVRNMLLSMIHYIEKN